MPLSWLKHLLARREAKARVPAPDWDAKYGTDTASGVALDALTIAPDSRRHGERYQPSDPQVLIDAVAFMGLTPSDYIFVDLGCGKGRMLIVAAELGFKACIGVEFADELAATAARNATASGFEHIRVVHGDAGDFAFADEIAPDQPFVLYLFNPFAAPVMAKVREHLLQRPRAVDFIVYKNARERHLFDQMTRLRYFGSPPTQKAGLLGVHIWGPRD